jgi:CheY-like chemotaxis protein
VIADDNVVSRRFLSTLLQAHGHRAIDAADGAEAIAIVRKERPDAVITDVLMPVMDGYALLREIRRDPATQSLPVVFYTAHYGARTLALANGATWFLTNADSAELLPVLTRVLAGESEMRASSGGSTSATMGRIEARPEEIV